MGGFHCLRRSCLLNRSGPRCLDPGIGLSQSGFGLFALLHSPRRGWWYRCRRGYAWFFKSSWRGSSNRFLYPRFNLAANRRWDTLRTRRCADLLSSNDRCFLLAAQFLNRDGLDPLAACLFDHRGGRTFVDNCQKYNRSQERQCRTFEQSYFHPSAPCCQHEQQEYSTRNKIPL